MRTRELRRKERAERELREARAAVEAKGAEARARQAAAAAAEEDIKRLEQALRESQARRLGGESCMRAVSDGRLIVLC